MARTVPPALGRTCTFVALNGKAPAGRRVDPHLRADRFIFVFLGWAAVTGCAGRDPPHVVDRSTLHECLLSERVSRDPSMHATVLIPSAVIVAPYRLPQGWERSAWPTVEPDPCEGPTRMLVPAGGNSWNVWVKTADEDVKLELDHLKLAAGELYELHVNKAGDVVTWELTRRASSSEQR